MDKKKIKSKYPKSINNYSCIGPCYFPNTIVKHPVFLEQFTDENKPFCPTQEFQIENEITGKKEKKIHDVCKDPSHKEDITTIESLVILQSGFTKDIFLSTYYDINSFDDAVEWIQNNSFTSTDTRTRIINAALNIYGDDMDFINEDFIIFYIEYIKEKEIKNIYKNIHTNIGVLNNEIFIVKNKDNKLGYNDLKIERINYVVQKFITKNEIKKFFSRFFEKKKKIFEEYDDILLLITGDFIEYIRKAIRNIL